MDRGFEIAKQCVAEPLTVFAFGAVLLAGGWQWLMRQGAAIKIAAGALVLFLLLAVISTSLSANPQVAIFGSYYRREGLLEWGVYGAFFFAMLVWARSFDRFAGFLDVLLLASVIPAAYAIQQRLGLDFYPLGARELTRPGATLGNPVFLAAYFALVLPMTAARCWQACQRRSEFALWLIVAVLQLCGLLLTQSRGPLLAVLMGGGLFACLLSASLRARRIFIGSATALFFLAVALLAINVVDGLRARAQDLPVMNRLVFDLDSGVKTDTQHASTSATSRLTIWGVGSATFNAAPLQRKLLGYGPESAYINYFSYMPAALIRLQGYGANRTFDRLHADSLDLVLNFGFVAWLVYCLFFCVVVYAAARALFGLSGRAPPWVFAACALSGGLVAAFATVQAEFASAMLPAFGLGVCVSWFLFIAVCAWRALRSGLAPMSPAQAERWKLLAGLTVSLSVFWLDAQVNIPVLTTRLISFGIAALVLIVADELVRGDSGERGSHPYDDDALTWGIGYTLVAVCASFLPMAVFDAPGVAPEVMHWGLRLLPLFIFVPFAAWAVSVRARGSGGEDRGWDQRRLFVAVGLPLAYAVIQGALMMFAGTELSFGRVLTTSIASMAAPIFIAAMCVACAVIASRSNVLEANALLTSSAARACIGVVAVAVVLAGLQDWRATRADIASTLAPQAAEKQPELSVQMIEEAVRLQPYERYYRRQLVFDLLGKAVADIPKLAQTPERIPEVVRNLADAETAARTAAQLFPQDPWVIVSLANVRQLQALRALRSLDPAGGLLAAQEANRIFAYTHRLFPNEPLALRNWAQLLFDQGNVQDAYRLLDLMEKLIPFDPEPYAERIKMARQVNDNYTVLNALERARGALSPTAFDRLSFVVK